MDSYLVACVQSNLSLGLYENARFLCERLCASNPCEQNKYLLAQCYRHCNQGYRAVYILQGSSSAQCRYLTALCSIDLRRYQDAEYALVCEGLSKIPNGAAGQYLLGLIHRRTGREASAAEHFRRALQKDPLMWSAYVELCALGYDQQAQQLRLPAELAQQPHIAKQQRQQQQQQQSRQPPPAPQQQQQQQRGARQYAGMAFSEALAFSAMTIEGSASVTPMSVTRDQRQDTPTSTDPLTHHGLVPQALSFITPSPGEGPAASFIHKGAGFPGFQAPGGPAGQRTPTLGKQKSGTAAEDHEGFSRRNKVSKAAGKLFAEPGTTPRRSARLAGHAAGDVTPSSSTHQHHHQQQQPSNQKHTQHHHDQQQQQHQRQLARQQHQQLRRDQQQQQEHDQQTPIGMDADTPVVGEAGCWEVAGVEYEGSYGGSMMGNGVLPTPVIEGASQEQRQQQQHQQQGLAGGGWPAAWPPERVDVSIPPPGPEVMSEVAASIAPFQAAVAELAQYRCQAALAALGQLPPAQAGSAAALVLVGRAHYEMVQYKAAADAFQAARQGDQYCLEGMEVYSSALWHLKREVELAHLAQECLALDRLDPITWCVVGNCLSLQREGEGAIRAFQRALQLRPHFAYAATLVGLEHFALEDLGAGLIAFQAALRADPRDYRALYGIGSIYQKQEKYKEALEHFSMAARLNPFNSVLRYFCGSALEKLNRHTEALAAYSAAIAADGKNARARLDRASLLLELDRSQEALEELQALQELAPREAQVHYLLGRAYKRLRQVEKALAAFQVALDLRPSTADKAQVKAAMDKVHLSDDEEEEEL